MNIETANRLCSTEKDESKPGGACRKIGVSRQAVSKWERAEASPDTDNLILLADIYGVSLDELLKGEKKSKAKHSRKNPKIIPKIIPTATQHTKIRQGFVQTRNPC